MTHDIMGVFNTRSTAGANGFKIVGPFRDQCHLIGRHVTANQVTLVPKWVHYFEPVGPCSAASVKAPVQSKFNESHEISLGRIDQKHVSHIPNFAIYGYE